jgi:hypothetical protein
MNLRGVLYKIYVFYSGKGKTWACQSQIGIQTSTAIGLHNSSRKYTFFGYFRFRLLLSEVAVFTKRQGEANLVTCFGMKKFLLASTQNVIRQKNVNNRENDIIALYSNFQLVFKLSLSIFK